MGMIIPGRTALITGASSGIGAATAVALASAGCRVVLVGRDEARLVEIAERIGGRAVPADLTDPAHVHEVASLAQDVDLLINNAGLGWAGDLTTTPVDKITELTEVNLTVPILLTRAALPAMERRKRGHVVFVSSIATVGVHNEAVYSATKAGIRAFAASIRYSATADTIGITTVFPGAVRTPFFDRRGEPYDRGFPRMVAPETVARALVRAVERGKPEVFVPGWLSLAARVQGCLPGAFRFLARRFG